MNKLNFGCGSIQPEGWDNVDIEDFGQTFIGSSSLFVDDTYDIIVAHCTLQIVPWHDLVVQLSDLRRILKSGGVLRISLPDILTGFRAYKEGDINWFPNGEPDMDDRFSAWLTWYSTTKTLLTPQATLHKLKEAGFTKAGLTTFKRQWEWGMGSWEDTIQDDTMKYYPEMLELDSREGEVFFVEAIK